ncbi:proline iminopeptidase-family hydrolase [Actinomadura opuntiae]|uniref:proline iminopeptidase-family hydrolase n=1 Tax=Actinomadura sp. OS1-43 TaxID=604315 RepID=UPI00255A7DBA|nr:proline iminopeptidase-family hydrolase [Actinomadura sp. OS1-43]MDL4821192.1 proline iminopeptidase-family hydrolase [Actinomadura sp. OS1-43]
MIAPATAEGHAPFRGHRTWYRVTGPSGASGPGKAPLVVLHGGPGCTHDYVLAFADLAAATGRQVIHYDQLGNGRSTHLPDAGANFWTVELFLDELDNLLAHLGIAGGYHLLGQSWGGMLGAEHAVRRPAGLRSLVIANSPASMPLWLEAAAGLRAALPVEVEATLREHEAAGTTDSDEYAKAMRVFYDRHVCRIPWPDEVARTFAAIDEDPTVYHTMNGPSEFHVVGTLRDWTIVDRLDRIASPTLVVSGRHDEATPDAVRPYADRIPGARWQIFEDSSHMPHVEEREACMSAVGAFLDAHDPTP